MRERLQGGRLADEMPEVRFPAGVGSPSAVLLVLMILLAGVSGAVLRTTVPSHVPDALRESQQRLAENVARSIGSSARNSISDLRNSAQISKGGSQALVESVLKSHTRWKGTAVLDGESRRILAASGESVPTRALPPVLDDSVKPLRLPDGDVRLLVSVKLSGVGREGQVLVGVSTARITPAPVDASLKQSLLLADGDGAIIDFIGNVPGAGDTAARALISRAVVSASAGQRGTVVGQPVADTKPGAKAGDARAVVVAYAPVGAEGLEGTLGLTALSTVNAPVSPPVTTQRGLVSAAGLVAVALFAFLLLRLAVVRPVRRLRASALAVASGRFRLPIVQSSVSEVQRIAAALAYCRTALNGRSDSERRQRIGVSAGAAVVLAAVAVLGWSAGTAYTLGRTDVPVPDSVVATARSQVGNTAEALRRSLNDSVADLHAIAGLSQGEEPDALRPTLERLHKSQSRYRALYIVDATGEDVVAVGRSPLRGDARPPAGEGLKQHNTTGRVPVFFAHVPLADKKHTLIGEFDLDYLTALLQRSPGRARLVDSGARTLVANHGYVAFQKVTDPALLGATTQALTGRSVTKVETVDGQRSVLVARVIGGRGPAASLRWAIVSDQPVAALALPGNELRRDALMVALIGVVLAILLFGWHYFLLIRPMRRLAAAADALADGDHKTVVYPQRQDQIGTIASCLEICRQALVEGADRLGTVRRPVGAATDATMLLTPIQADRHRAEV